MVRSFRFRPWFRRISACKRSSFAENGSKYQQVGIDDTSVGWSTSTTASGKSCSSPNTPVPIRMGV